MFKVAEAVQSHLATATQSNAPNLRYSIILGELQREARRVIDSASQTTSSGDPGTSSSSGPQTDPASTSDQPLALESDLDIGSMDFPLDPNLWMQLDSFPFSMCKMLINNHASVTDLRVQRTIHSIKTTMVSPEIRTWVQPCNEAAALTDRRDDGSTIAERIRCAICMYMRDARCGCAVDCAHFAREIIFQPRRFPVTSLFNTKDTKEPQPSSSAMLINLYSNGGSSIWVLVRGFRGSGRTDT